MSEKPETDPHTCERCGKEPATVRVRRVTDEEEVERHLCLACAQIEGVEPGTGGSEGLSPDPLSVLMKSIGATRGGGGVCAGCGLTYARFRETGRLGCDRCYETFSEELTPMLRRIQGSIRHQGKRPRREGAAYEQGARLRRLSEELERAVGDEDYERAAEIRDRIRAMETADPSGEKQKR
jgi:protein arginine kinase activator